MGVGGYRARLLLVSCCPFRVCSWNPWMRDIYPPEGRENHPRRRLHGWGDDHEMPEDPTDEELDMMWRMQEDLRETWTPGIAGAHNFYTMVRGGKWTYRKKKKAADVMIATCRPGVPAEFCRVFKMGVLHSFSIDRYGELGCSMLALETRRRLEHY